MRNPYHDNRHPVTFGAFMRELVSGLLFLTGFVAIVLGAGHVVATVLQAIAS